MKQLEYIENRKHRYAKEYIDLYSIAYININEYSSTKEVLNVYKKLKRKIHLQNLKELLIEDEDGVDFKIRLINWNTKSKNEFQKIRRDQRLNKNTLKKKPNNNPKTNYLKCICSGISVGLCIYILIKN